MDVLTTISPINSKVLVATQATTLDQLDSKILPEVCAAQRKWHRSTSLAQRKELVLRAMEILTDEKTIQTLAIDITRQMGRPIKYTPGELKTAALRARYLIDVSDQVLAPINANNPKSASIEFENGFKKYITHEPLGVVLLIFPWNYPYLCLINALVPALLAGNAALIKPSPQTPLVAENIKSVFEKAGLPKGILQVVHSGDPLLIETLIQRPSIAAVSFTGSVAGGLAIQRAASSRTIPVALELGGNDPAYVRTDVADLRATAEDIVDGCIFNSGQSCCAIERVYVAAEIYDEFLSHVVDIVKAYKVGDPLEPSTQIGPLVSKQAADKVRAQVADAIKHGGRQLIPIGHFSKAESLNPTFVGPQVLVDMDDQALVLTEETFGPLIPIVKVHSDDEAVAKMNNSDLGLTASIWTKDTAWGEALGDLVEAGTVFVNRADYPDPALAWTGWKSSGRGVTLSQFGFDFFRRLKSHHIKQSKL
ncbi:ALDH-like protein [Nadsonia fulvescens var. elongata DSM 6958]|uniref:ALDH-like protein n=1 Tax=Nadsonia fulvescens var. elongata DSM 6958 TaxID=857566 RepID=A0A1E3PRB7_9ASCO|nr:ALDH-like protein [Nadsonia fulvescens var. elongata DSM 6958]